MSCRRSFESASPPIANPAGFEPKGLKTKEAFMIAEPCFRLSRHCAGHARIVSDSHHSRIVVKEESCISTDLKQSSKKT